jgi:hypothetical protein
MTRWRCVLICAALATAPVAIGCVHHHHDEGPVVVDYTYEPGYYDRGYYRDNDWYWRDRYGHERHEARDEHESRMRDWHPDRHDDGDHDRH